MNKLIGIVCVGSALVLSGCTWFDWTNKSSCNIEHKSTCPCDMKDCHCPPGKCTCKKEPSLQATPVAATSTVIEINSEKEFEEKVLDAKKPAVVEFGAPWCDACRKMVPVFEEVAKEMGAKYVFTAVNVDKTESIAKKYGITGIPAFLFFKNGKEVKDGERVIGATSKENFKKAVDDNLGD